MISIIIPVYNEEGSIKNIIEDIKKVMSEKEHSYEIIVVDDGSTDESGKIVSKLKDIKLVSHPHNMGYGASIKSGIRIAKGDFILITDADGTYPIYEIPKLLDYAKKYDMVVGARTSKKVYIPFFRRPAKFFLGKLANFLTGKKIPDLNSGFRIFKKEIADEFFHLFPSKFSFTTTLTLACLTNDYSVKYIAIDYYKRKGKSSINPVKDFIGFSALIFRVMTFFRPFRMFSALALIMFFIAVLVFLYSFFVLGRVMDITVIVILLSSLQIFLFGLLAELVVKSRR